MKILFSKSIFFIFFAFLITFSFFIFQTIKQTDFYLNSNCTLSKVVSVLTENELSKGSWKQGKSPHTRFYVNFEYFVNENKYELQYETTKKGYDYPKNNFEYLVGNKKLLRYDKRNPNKSNFHSVFAVFIFPIVLLFFSTIFGIVILRNINDIKKNKIFCETKLKKNGR